MIKDIDSFAWLKQLYGTDNVPLTIMMLNMLNIIPWL